MKKCKFTSVAKIRYLLTALLILAGVTSVYGADIVLKKDCSFPNITIRGELKVGDSQKLDRAFSEIAAYSKNSIECKRSGDKFYNITVSLDSEGGDVDVALDMGRIIRREKQAVYVPVKHKCFSACVFLLAAGVQRVPNGDNVGIHRPYFSALSNTEDVNVVRAKREAINKKIKAYFDEMDISQSLLDLMLSIPPGEIKILSKTELVSFRLSGDDPTHDEMETAKSAYQYNTTSAEFRKRWGRASANCPSFESTSNDLEKFMQRSRCRTAILLNITERELEKRADKFEAVCKYQYNSKEQMQCYRDIVTLGK
jgi:ATP-dependent protease ClpP protease subunit